MSRITMALENDFEGRVLVSFDLDEFANKVRIEAIDECIKVVDEVNWAESDHYIGLLKQLKGQI